MEIEQEAKLQGWAPQEDFKGNPDKWVDAETYVERGRQIMPILQNNNKRLVSEIDSVKSVVESLKATIATQTQSMQELKKFHEESSKAQVEKARRDLLSELKTAKSEGDVDQEIQLTSDLSKFDAAQVAAQTNTTVAVVPTGQPSNQVPELQPYVKQWMDANPWYGQDVERTDMMDAVAMRMKREKVSLVETAFLEEASRIVSARFPSETHPSKVEGGTRGESSASPRASSSYNSLPADAKAQCEKQASSFVGEHLLFKTKKDWQEYFTAEYHKVS